MSEIITVKFACDKCEKSDECTRQNKKPGDNAAWVAGHELSRSGWAIYAEDNKYIILCPDCSAAVGLEVEEDKSE